MDEQTLRQLLQRSGLSRITDAIITHSRPAIRVHTRPAEEEVISVGDSKMGGFPDLPPGYPYPRWHEAMGFIGQFNLATIHPFDHEALLPDHGLLSFFFETDGEPRYSERLAGMGRGQRLPREAQRKGWQVLYFDADPVTFTRYQPTNELPEDEFYPSCAVNFSHALTILHTDAPEMIDLGLAQRERDALIEIDIKVNHGNYGDHQLLGLPVSLDFPPFLECSNLWDQYQRITPAERIILEREINNQWTLLFQVTSSGELAMDWAGGGLVQFCIERAALRERDFSQVWLDMQFL